MKPCARAPCPSPPSAMSIFPPRPCRPKRAPAAPRPRARPRGGDPARRRPGRLAPACRAIRAGRRAPAARPAQRAWHPGQRLHHQRQRPHARRQDPGRPFAAGGPQRPRGRTAMKTLHSGATPASPAVARVVEQLLAAYNGPLQLLTGLRLSEPNTGQWLALDVVAVTDTVIVIGVEVRPDRTPPTAPQAAALAVARLQRERLGT